MRPNIKLSQCSAILLLLLTPLNVWADVNRLDQALELKEQGKLKGAEAILDQVLPDLRSSRDFSRLGKALRARADISLSLGEYEFAIKFAREDRELNRLLKDQASEARDLNVMGASAIYLGNYGSAVKNFEAALKLDRALGNAEGEAARLDNLGNAYYFEGRYQEAFQSYQAALEKGAAAGGAPWVAQRNQITITNLATLYQRLGADGKALELYRSLGTSPLTLSPSQKAQLLLNQGALYRRLGDPVKAVELYRRAQGLFAQDHNLDTEIGAWRNIGIAQALDLGDLSGAFESFSTALRLAQKSSNARGAVQAQLYRGEVLRRMHRALEAQSEFQRALDGAEKADLVDDQWSALVALGHVAEEMGHINEALGLYQRGIFIIESMRAGLTRSSLRTEFLADKRNAYDSLIALQLSQAGIAPADLFRVLEQTRARTLQDRSKMNTAVPLAAIQGRLRQDTLLLEFWMADKNAAVLWITQSQAGVRAINLTPNEVDSIPKLLDAVQQGGREDWRQFSSVLGRKIFDGVPLGDSNLRHLIIVPDGLLQIIPFEVLTLPTSATPVIEKYDVTYLPSASLLSADQQDSSRGWAPPWRRVLVAFGDPAGSILGAAQSAFPPSNERWQPLPHSAEEVRAIAQVTPGSAEIHLGADARKKYLVGNRVENVPVIHFSTHAAVDMEDPERSRILLASAEPQAQFDYLFLREVQELDFKGVDLVTLSACETERGKVIRGEGEQSFSRALLSAGARSTLASLWQVSDAPTAQFMKQFYYAMARGDSEGEALRWTKLRFLHSGSGLAHPRYWAAFVLSGNSQVRLPHVLSWAVLASGFGIVLAAILIFHTCKQRR